MEQALKIETERLIRSWSQHEAAWLRDYLVAGVEDPRINLQSILSRHLVIQAIEGAAHAGLMDEEYRFSAVMNWLVDFTGKSAHLEDLELVQYALERGADNAEGIEIPLWVTHAYASLPVVVDGKTVPNYVKSFLEETSLGKRNAVCPRVSQDTFCQLWRELFEPGDRTGKSGFNQAPFPRVTVLEPACGSANDFRAFVACGLGPMLDYSGFDLCENNIQNAHKLFPNVRFETGNVFEIGARDKSFDCCIIHDLFEHLSLEGMHAAIREICRVTRRHICIGFFQMDEIPEHVVRPVDEYHWNLLSAGRTRDSFAAFGFQGRVFHIGTFLRAKTGCDRFHNPNAYTFWLEVAEAGPQSVAAK